MPLGNKKTVEEVRLVDVEKRERFKIAIIEEILSDGSKAYNVETAFYGELVMPVLLMEDASSCNFNEAWKKFRAIKNALSVFEDSQLL